MHRANGRAEPPNHGWSRRARLLIALAAVVSVPLMHSVSTPRGAQPAMTMTAWHEMGVTVHAAGSASSAEAALAQHDYMTGCNTRLPGAASVDGPRSGRTDSTCDSA